MGSEIRTHYPQSVAEGIAITRQESWNDRGSVTTEVADYIYEIIEQIAFVAREDKKVDKRSGVSQRLPISTVELAVSNAERRALLHGESLAVPRVGDIYTALPGITGKIELEYEGEMKGADVVVREIIRTAILRVYDQYFADTNTQQIEQWFNLGGTVQLNDAQSSRNSLEELKQIQGLFEKLTPLEMDAKSQPVIAVSAAEFLLEGMYAHKRLSRAEERIFSAAEKKTRTDEASRYGEKMREREIERDDYAKNRTRRGFN
jgi:magnesium chelatase subunit I